MIVLSCFDEDPNRDFFALARSRKNCFERDDDGGVFTYNLDDSVVLRVPAFESWYLRGTFTQLEVRVSD